MKILIVLFGVLAGLLVVSLLWRWASRLKSLPCPTILAWFLENPIAQRLNGTAVTLERIGLRPGQSVLEFGPGPGRLLIPAAARVLPGGKVCGIELQAGMIERLRRNAHRKGVANMTVVRGDATLPVVDEATFDIVLLSCVLGEIPDRHAVLRQAFRALRPAGRLSVSEMFGDPHYQSRSTLKQLAHDAGFELEAIHGRWYMFTANFRKPADASTSAASQAKGQQ